MNDFLLKRTNRVYLTHIYLMYLSLLFVLCVAGLLWYPNNNCYERGAAVYFPKYNAVTPQEFEVTGSAYALEGLEGARIVLMDGQDEFSTPIEFEKVYYKDKLLMQLSTFKTTVSAPHDGCYNMHLELAEKDGVVNVFAKRTITVDADQVARPFTLMSIEHLSALGSLAVMITVLLLWAVKKKTVPMYNTMAITSCAVIAVCDLIIRSLLLFTGTFRASYDMAFHMCDISGYLMPVLLFTERERIRDGLYNLMFIWGIGGALMAILTPEMGGFNFPSYYFFNFFLKHGAIIFGVLLITFVRGIRPRIKSLPKILLIGNIMAAVVYGINQLLKFAPPFDVGNYLFISYPPTGGSAIDLLVNIFGPSPWYLIGMNILCVIIYVLLWVPFAVERAIKEKRVQREKLAA